MNGFTLLAIIIPALVVSATTYFLMMNLMNDRKKDRFLTLQKEIQDKVLPVRLQAYERVVLMLERMHPGSLIFRVSASNQTASELHVALLTNIRDEFEHNLSQQVYISTFVWDQVVAAKEALIKQINSAALKIDEQATANELAQAVFQETVESGVSSLDDARNVLKQGNPKTILMKHVSIWLFIMLLAQNVWAQKDHNTTMKITSPEVWWAVTHPFKAFKAIKTTKEVFVVVQKKRAENYLDGDIAGGTLDAFKHTYWMTRMGQEIGIRAARKLGVAHEKGNKKTFYKNLDRFYVANDAASSKMDLLNNEMGLQLSLCFPHLRGKALMQEVEKEIMSGGAYRLKKSKEKELLDADGNVLKQNELKGEWVNKKVVVKSDYVPL